MTRNDTQWYPSKYSHTPKFTQSRSPFSKLKVGIKIERKIRDFPMLITFCHHSPFK